MQSIDKFRGYFKGVYQDAQRRRDLLIIVIIMLVGISSFSLGFLAGSSNKDAQIRIADNQEEALPAAAYASQQQNEAQKQAHDGTVVASENADHFHLPWCAGAQQINEENKVYFSSKTKARDAGYEPAANCPGLDTK